MAKRLLPFRQYDEKDVINEFFVDFQLEDQTENPNANGANDNGVLVGDPGLANKHDTINYTYGNSADPRKQHSSPVGRNGYPYPPGYLKPLTNGTQIPVGITLNQTLKYDENGEPLLYNPEKLTELQAVLPYQAVPVATAGIFTLSASAFDAEVDVGDYLTWDLNRTGKFIGFDDVPAFVLGGRQPIAVVLAKGERSSGDAFPGKYYIIKLDIGMAFKF